MTPVIDHDAVIVGGGACGLALACLLAARGLDVVVLEQRTAPGRRSRAIGIHAAGLSVLDRVGIGAQVRREAAVVERGVAMCRGRRLGAFDFGDAPVRTLPQHRTEALLAARLAQLAPGALQRGRTATRIEQRADCVLVESRSGEGTVTERSCRVLVGADGGRSAVRGWIDAGWDARGARGHYAMADELDPRSPPSTAVLHLEPDGVVERLPMPDGVRRWVVRLPAPIDSLQPPEFAALIRERLGDGPDPAALGVPAPFITGQHLARRVTRGRVALLGDAAHVLSPIGGQGMTLGWLDAVVLDRAIAAIVDGQRPHRAFLPVRRRRRAASRAMRRAALNTFLGRPASGGWLRLRTALVRLLAASWLRPVTRAVVTIRR